MKKHAVIFRYANHDKIAEARPRHRAYLASLLAEGKLLTAGPFEDDSGALIVYLAESPEEVEEFIKRDPFFEAGIFADYTIRPWKQVLVR